MRTEIPSNRSDSPGETQSKVLPQNPSSIGILPTLAGLATLCFCPGLEAAEIQIPPELINPPSSGAPEVPGGMVRQGRGNTIPVDAVLAERADKILNWGWNYPGIEVEFHQALNAYQSQLDEPPGPSQEAIDRAVTFLIENLGTEKFYQHLNIDCNSKVILDDILPFYKTIFRHVNGHDFEAEWVEKKSAELIQSLVKIYEFGPDEVNAGVRRTLAGFLFDGSPETFTRGLKALNGLAMGDSTVINDTVLLKTLLERGAELFRQPDLNQNRSEFLRFVSNFAFSADQRKIFYAQVIEGITEPESRQFLIEFLGPLAGKLASIKRLSELSAVQDADEGIEALLNGALSHLCFDSYPPIISRLLASSKPAGGSIDESNEIDLVSSRMEIELSLAYLCLGSLSGESSRLSPVDREALRESLAGSVFLPFTDEQRAQLIVAFIHSGWVLDEEGEQSNARPSFNTFARYLDGAERGGEPGRYVSHMNGTEYDPPVQAGGDPVYFADQYFYVRDAISRATYGMSYREKFPDEPEDGFVLRYEIARQRVMLCEVIEELSLERNLRPVSRHREMRNPDFRRELEANLNPFGCFRYDPEMRALLEIGDLNNLLIRVSEIHAEAQFQRDRAGQEIGRRLRAH